MVCLNSYCSLENWWTTAKWKVPPLHIFYFYFSPFVLLPFVYSGLTPPSPDKGTLTHRGWPAQGVRVGMSHTTFNWVVGFVDFLREFFCLTTPLKLWYNDHYILPTFVLMFRLIFSYWFIWLRCIRFEFRTWWFLHLEFSYRTLRVWWFFYYLRSSIEIRGPCDPPSHEKIYMRVSAICVFSVLTPLPQTRSVYVPDKTRGRSIRTAEYNCSPCTSRSICNIRLPVFFFFYTFITNPRTCTRYYFERFANTVKSHAPNSGGISLFNGTRNAYVCTPIGSAYCNWPNGMRAARTVGITRHKSSTPNIELPPLGCIQSAQNSDRIEGLEIMDLCNQIIETYRSGVIHGTE